MKTIKMKPEDFKACFRMEKPFPDMDEDTEICLEEDVELTLEDIKQTIETIIAREIEADDVNESWYCCVEDALYSSEYGIKTQTRPDSVYGLPACDSDFWTAYHEIDSYIFDDEVDLKHLKEVALNDIDQAIKCRSMPIFDRTYSDEEKECFIRLTKADDILAKATPEVLEYYVKFVNELCDKDNIGALYAKAYGCYGGNEAFACDWVASRDALIRLTKLVDDPYLHNTLGYIYYYGRCNGGKPEYDKAFREYSIGAAAWIYESRYKLADMFMKGKGVPKSENIATTIIGELYDQNLKHFIKGDYGCKFADVALRMGGIYENGNGEFIEDAMTAYYYYLQARMALDLRREYNHYGDGVVSSRLDEAISRVREKLADTIKENSCQIYSLDNNVRNNLVNGHRIQIQAEEIEPSGYKLTMSIVKRGDEEKRPELLIVVPELDYCDMVDEVSFRFYPYENGFDVIDFHENPVIVFDEIIYNSLYNYGEDVGSLKGEIFFDRPRV